MKRAAVLIRCAVAALVFLGQSAHAEGLEAIQQILANRDASPVPPGWTVGAAAYSGSSAYSAGASSNLAIPGGIYIDDQVMYLGDRIFYTFGRQGPVSYFGRLRVRLGNLDPADSPEWTGLTPRKGQLEAGLGAVVMSPVGLWTARFSSDISGRSKGTEPLPGLVWTFEIPVRPAAEERRATLEGGGTRAGHAQAPAVHGRGREPAGLPRLRSRGPQGTGLAHEWPDPRASLHRFRASGSQPGRTGGADSRSFGPAGSV